MAELADKIFFWLKEEMKLSKMDLVTRPVIVEVACFRGRGGRGYSKNIRKYDCEYLGYLAC